MIDRGIGFNMDLHELRRLTDQLSEDQLDYLETVCESRFSSRGTLAGYYEQAVKLGWLLGPA